MRHGLKTMLRLLAVMAIVAALAACDEAANVADGVNQVAEGVDTAQECASIAGDVASINLNLEQTSAADVRQGVEELERTVDGIESVTLRDAADGLATQLSEVAAALERADIQEAQQALRDASAAVQEVAAACNIPVDEISSELSQVDTAG